MANYPHPVYDVAPPPPPPGGVPPPPPPPPPPGGVAPQYDGEQPYPQAPPAAAGAAIPAPATQGKIEEGKPWIYFFGGLGLGFVAGIFALIPLCIFRELKQNRRNRKYYLWGSIPFVIFNTLVIILVTFLVVIGAVNAASIASQ